MPSENGAVPAATRHSVAVLGLGYVGLPTSLALTGAGHHVVGIDVDPARRAAIARGDVDLVPTERQQLTRSLSDRSFTVTGDVDELSRVDAIVICLPTPVDGHRVPELGPLREGCRMVTERVRPGALIVLTSTSYVGTTADLLLHPLEQAGYRCGQDVFIAYSPERIDPGNADYPQSAVPRLFGGATPACGAKAAALLGSTSGGVHIVPSMEMAELAKLLENTFRAVNISLANELADACVELGLSPVDVIDAAATKPYGFMPFFPGSGVGGHCIPVDPHYLLWQMRSCALDLPVLERAMTGILTRPRKTVERIVRALMANGTVVTGARVLVAGVTYKPGVRDTRESPAIEIMQRLRDLGVQVSYFDPLLQAAPSGIEDFESASRDGERTVFDLIVLHTAHPALDLSWAKSDNFIDCNYGRASLEMLSPPPVEVGDGVKDRD
jgi:UDP-N-acetyl-D-glucosamine dehydrogenase